MTARGCVVMASLLIGAWIASYSQDMDTRRAILASKELLRQGDNTSRAEYFEQAKALLAGCHADSTGEALAEYYCGYADYRLGVVIHRMDKEKAITYLDSAADHLKRATDLRSNFADAYALLGSCYGIKITHSPIKGIILGPMSQRAMDKAKAIAPENPRVALLDAIRIFNTPSMFGGGKDEGLQAMRRAAQLFERWMAPDTLVPDWGKAEVYAWIGIAYIDRKESALARQAFELALKINPEYGWVKYGLSRKVTPQTSGAQ
jgi:tetratricopeptide (TPR) repeat protein